MGRLYGAATTGASLRKRSYFQLTPTPVGEWDFKTLYSFHGNRYGSFPYGGVASRCFGKIYGTTYYGGQNGIGAVYELSPRPTGEWRERVIYSFKSATTATADQQSVSDAAAIFMERRVRRFGKWRDLQAQSYWRSVDRERCS